MIRGASASPRASGASATFRMLSRDTVGQVKGAAALVGREGLLLFRSSAASAASSA